jgi:hypothetical protein
MKVVVAYAPSVVDGLVVAMLGGPTWSPFPNTMVVEMGYQSRLGALGDLRYYRPHSLRDRDG